VLLLFCSYQASQACAVYPARMHYRSAQISPVRWYLTWNPFLEPHPEVETCSNSGHQDSDSACHKIESTFTEATFAGAVKFNQRPILTTYLPTLVVVYDLDAFSCRDEKSNFDVFPPHTESRGCSLETKRITSEVFFHGSQSRRREGEASVI
jgi:hypothetical protein